MTLSEMYGRVSSRLNEDFGAGGPTYYPTAEIIAAVNEGQRLFCLITLILENTVAWNVPTAAAPFFRMLQVTNPPAALGIVNVSGTTLTWSAGQQFEVEAWATPFPILLNNVAYSVLDVGSPTVMTIDRIATPGAAGYALPTIAPSPLLFPDWIVPLRFAAQSTGAKIRPARLDDLLSLDSQWVASPGNPVRYAHLGADLVALYQQPALPFVINVTYARCPVPLANDTDEPQIPREYHPQLVNYAINRVRQVEGAEELTKTAGLLSEYLDAAQKCADFVRAKNRGGQYDTAPFELSGYDRSQLLGLRSDLMPKRRVTV